MKLPIHSLFAMLLGSFASSTAALGASFEPPISYEKADERAGALLAKMTTDQKLKLISGHNQFFICGFPELGIPELYLSDATQGVHIRKQLSNQLAKSVAFPAPVALAATWNPELAYRYAKSVGEECRAGDIAVLLGPGMNIYRVSQCGRNFEYFGEDPYLAARMVEQYVRGVQGTGTMATLKHFVTNNTDHRRRTSNSIVDERTLHEIYLPAFQAGIDAGAMAVMTSYNQVNGEWAGQSKAVITDLLRGQLGFKGLVMTDWTSVWDAEKIIRSGQDLEMPGNANIAQDAAKLLADGKVTIAEIDRMARSILRTCIAFGFYDRPLKDESFLANYPTHERVALATAREGIVLLRNQGVLPLVPKGDGKILVTGLFVDKLARGGGSADVEGYNSVSLQQALTDIYGERATFVAEPTDDQVKSATAVLVSTGTRDSEGSDRPFALPEAEEKRIQHLVTLNPRTVVIVNSGAGIQMTGWNEQAAAIVYAWYPGQLGNRALAEVLAGVTNPSGKLPMTIERRFEDAPGFGYVPAGETVGKGYKREVEMSFPVYPIEYKEGVLVGYRWYDTKKIAPLYAFGSGLSYTHFEFGQLAVAATKIQRNATVTVTCTVKNAGQMAGAEVVQLYVHPENAPVARPEKELKGFAKVKLAPGETHTVTLTLKPQDFAYWDVTRHNWTVAPGRYEIRVGGASDRLPLHATVTLE